MLTLVAVLAVTGCSPAPATVVQAGRTSGPTLTASTVEATAEYMAPPRSVPAAEYEGVVLEPAMYSWRVGEQMQQLSPASDTTVSRNQVPAPTTPDFTAALRTAVPPVQIRMLYYATRFAPDAPAANADPVRIDCGTTPDLCRVQTGTQVQTITYTGGVAAGSTLVLQVDYPTFEDIDKAEGVTAYSASWVIDFSSAASAPS